MNKLIVIIFAAMCLMAWPKKEKVKIDRFEFKYSVGKLTKTDAG
jgi:hypothetical protein